MSSTSREQESASRKLTGEMVLALFDALDIPFITSSLIANEFDCSDQTARNRLAELVEEGRLRRYDSNGRHALWFRPDHSVASDIARQLRQYFDLTNLKTEYLEPFAEQPYKLEQNGDNEYQLHVPRFVPFGVGRLEEVDGGWATYVIDKYVYWLEDLPEELESEIDISGRFSQATVTGDILELANQEEREEAWEELGEDDDLLAERVGEDKIRIESGKEFEVIVDLIQNGNLPFEASPIGDEDLRNEPEGFELREYQEPIWDTFRETGQVGIYWGPSLGKTYISLYAGDRLEGEKLVLVPQTSLQQQWRDVIADFCRNPDEWTVQTYQYFVHNDNLEDYLSDTTPTLTIFDEAHYLPAEGYSKLSTIGTDYRISLSATPYREDGRTDLIFALSGIPLGLDWPEYRDQGIIEYPDMKVYLYSSEAAKRDDLNAILNERQGKTAIFCDGIDAGNELSEELEIPFVSGDTPAEERMETFEEHDLFVASRIADEGVSIEDLCVSIEHDFLGGSRRQALQRVGRLMHSNRQGEHILQMTHEEFRDHSKRLLSIEEKGIDIQIERRD